MNSHRGVGLHTIEGIHQVDHLGVVCMGLQIPLLFTDEKQHAAARHYYPQLDARLVDFFEVAPDQLSQKYNVIFTSNFCNSELFSRQFFSPSAEGKKAIRSVYCPHGNSDKGHNYYWMEMFAEEDIVFLYGQRMIDFLKEKGVFHRLQNYVRTGNYRYPFYRANREFYRQIIQDEVSSRLPKAQRTVLYAPTWNKGDSSFFSAYAHVCDNLPKGWNLIVKVHPGLEAEHFGALFRVMSQYEGSRNILFLKDFPLVYPLLELCDLYIGDMSSIGYDFLAFNKPMYFLNEYAAGAKQRNDIYLFRCGVEITPGNYGKLYDIMNDTLDEDSERFSLAREQTYDYCFGEERSFDEIHSELMRFCNQDN